MVINGGAVYTTADGREVDYSDDIRWSDTHHGKYSDGMANYLAHADSEDEWTGSVEWHGYVQRFGKRLLHSDDRGFVTVERYESVQAAKARFEEIDAEYCAWSEQEEDDA